MSSTPAAEADPSPRIEERREEPSAAPQIPKRRRRAFFAIGVTVICLVISEIAIRILTPFPFRDSNDGLCDRDAIRGWSLISGEHRFPEHGREIVYTVKDGARITRSGSDSGGPRVAIVGCSFTAGEGL